jgi:penicillin amidase
MRRLIRIFLRLLLILFILAVICAVGGYVYLRRSLPQVSGSEKVQGLKASVTVIRGVDDVPHIFAQNKLDAYAALGYVHAQDRLWQMELQRRVGQGRLAEIFGQRALIGDRFVRTLGIYRAATADWQSSSGESKEIISAYVAGINAYISSHGGSGLPPEFTGLRFSPEPWTGPDVLVWVKVMSLNLDGVGYLTELLRNDVVHAVGPDVAQQLLPPYPDDGPTIVSPQDSAQSYGRLAAMSREVRDAIGLSRMGDGSLGSNCWVVDGTKSTTGKPLLANDPHLGTSLPSTWYLAHLSAPNLDVIGATVPGLPMIVMGRNRYIAWGVTHLSTDVQDMFRERLDANGTSAEFQGRMEPLKIVNETIKVKGQADVPLTVRETRHGPLISDVLNAANATLPAAERPPELEPTAMRWTALEPGDRTVESFLLVDEAQNWSQFTTALRGFVAPALNFVYADAEGNIGYYGAARLAIRQGNAGLSPVEGWTGTNEWTGWIPFEEQPHAYNPPEHFIVTANNRPVPADYPYFLGQHWSAPYRAQRIKELLTAKEKLSAEDQVAIQGDTVSLQARELLPVLLALTTPRDDEERRAIELLKSWDGNAQGASGAAAIYEAWVQGLPRALVADKLNPELTDRYEDSFGFTSRFLLNTLRESSSKWCDNTKTPETEDCSSVAERTLRQALDKLKALMGGDISKWRWDSIHAVVFTHRPFHGIGWLRRFFSRRLPNGGDRSTIDFGAFDQNFEQYVAPGYREVIDLSNTEGGRFIEALGQSGHFLSPHYDDYTADWLALRYRPMRMERSGVEQNGAATLRLEP